MVAGREASPQDIKNTQRLKRYWAHGEGRAKIAPEAPGAFRRCQLHLSKYLPPGQVDGYCARVIHDATGMWPGSAAYNASHGHGTKSNAAKRGGKRGRGKH